MNRLRGIYALCDTTLNPNISHRDLAEKLVRGGVKILQLRMKGEQDPDRVRRVALAIQGLKKNFSFSFILNDFVEIAQEIGADGIHLGKDDMTIAQTRKIVGPGMLIGYSSHSYQEALDAEAVGADYVALGAVFPTATKGPGHPVVGIRMLREVVTRINVPVVAIGGINRENFSEVAATGVDAIAMIGALTMAKDITEETRWFLKEFERDKEIEKYKTS